ncbi:hypothetical protein OIDMADRAFT_139056 [Oidiodendron maius Zn]|uniref:DUF7702 domain-containing protein n=1 Tax=Oidiodendron maius (strain Zn) TaxID=913774 RepID=A0A0C3G978_OIDMZ|nr:hypothetical protein OIDMADRAFT_139056 [Oidiodendron maius Zn]
MLDSHGKLALAEVVIYVPVGLLCIFNNVRHGFQKAAGWIYLTIFAIIKIAASIMTIQIEQGKDANLATTAAILSSVALSPLLSATLSFMNVGLQDTHSFVRHVSTVLKPLHLLIIVGLALSVIGGINRTKTTQSALDDGAKEVQVAVIIFALVWIFLVIACLVYLSNLSSLRRYARKLVISVGLALPVIVVRVIYSLLNAVNLDTSKSGDHTGQYNPITGSWILYLALGLCPEVVVVSLYTLAGSFSSHNTKDKPDYHEMNPHAPQLDYN